MRRLSVIKRTVFFVVVSLVARGAWADAADEALALAQRTLAYVEKAEKRPEMAAALAKLAQRVPETRDAAGRAALEGEIRALRRQILFSHPDLAFDRLLASQRGLPYSHATHMVDQYLGCYSHAGPGLVVLENWKTAPKKVEILKGKMPEGTVLNPDLHWDGDRVLFAFCDHTAQRTEAEKGVVAPTALGGVNKGHVGDTVLRVDPENPCFNFRERDKKDFDPNPTAHRRYAIWEAALDGSWVRQLTCTPKDKMETWEGRQSVLIEDVDPCYLPDGGFAFSSTRCQGYGRCHGARYAPSMMLYRADGDGSNIRQLSYGEANEWEPAVLNDGRLAYTRWDYIDRNAVPWQSLWAMNPDGTGTSHFFGNYTPNPTVMSEIRPIPGTHVVVATAAAHHFVTAGSLILIDTRKGEDGLEAITRVTPEIPFPESEGWKDVGYYAAPYPVNDTLFFASYAPDAYTGGAYDWSHAWPSNNAFGVWLVDTLGGREKIYQDQSIGTFTPIPIRKVQRPPVIPSLLPPAETAPDYGVCSVENVYDCRVPLEKGSVKFMRLNRIFGKPTANDPECSIGYALYKCPIGVVPVAADGSVSFRMPAGVPVQLQALNEEGMAVMTMRSFIYAHRGESVRCAGCHENRMQAPIRPVTKAQTVAVPTPVPCAADGVDFTRNVQPILDRHCIGCHGLNKEKVAGKLDLIGGEAYKRLLERKAVVRAMPYSETGSSTPNNYYAIASPLTAMLKKKHHDVELSKAEWESLIVWMDMNAQRLSGYGFNLNEQRHPDPTGEAMLRKSVEALFGKEVAEQPYAALVNVGAPEKSRVLLAALPVDKGGWGQFKNGFSGTEDLRYRALQSLVQCSIAPNAYRDVCGTCGRGKDCICYSCWVWMGHFNEPPQPHP